MVPYNYGFILCTDVIFVDSPVNVGFSYSEDPRDRVFDEATVADDLLDFMQQFLKGVPRPLDNLCVSETDQGVFCTSRKVAQSFSCTSESGIMTGGGLRNRHVHILIMRPLSGDDVNEKCRALETLGCHICAKLNLFPRGPR